MYEFGEDELEAVSAVMRSKEFFRYRNEGLSETEKLEQQIAKQFGVEYANVMSSGTAGLISSLVAMGLGPGDEVIIPTYTWMGSALAILATGAIPILCDIDESLTLDTNDVARHLTSRTKIINPVHMNGFPCDMDSVCQVAQDSNLKVLEDACQAVGGSYKDRFLGTIGNAGVYSYNMYKTITCGEGGCVVTNDKEIHHAAMIYHDGGCFFRSWAQNLEMPIFAGVNFRLNDILSSILSVQHRRLPSIISKLRSSKAMLLDRLAGIEQINCSKINCKEGDCSTAIAFTLNDKDLCSKFEANSPALAKRLETKIWKALDSERHVWLNWKPLIEYRGAFTELRNPYSFSDVVNYSREKYQKSYDILSNTFLMSISPVWEEESVERIVEAVKEAMS